MKKHELLVPAGNMDCLKQAVYNGCDAVYLACKNFGARKFANNFDQDEILEAISFCHLYGVRIYVTMNTLVKNDEVDDFLKQAAFLHKNGVDALIVQDFGMICLLRNMFPNLEIHASTQANISSQEVCQLYYDLGVKRVVFSRELSIDEIDSINVPIEKEAFIHGALCISYSGCCLMSSMLGGRSGNRGECAGVCRMPFSLLKDGKELLKNQYLLSTKELNTSSKIDRLKDSSIYSFKIEGRMKSPLYVGFITNFYRHLLDGKDFDLDNETKRLKTIFNREFTTGRLFETKDEDFMNTISPNHIGLEIGKVIEVTKQKIKIKLNSGCNLHQHDAIRFLHSQEGFVVNYLYDENGNLTSFSDDICYVDNKIHLKRNDIVSKTSDYLLEEEYLNKDKKKIEVSFSVFVREGQPLKITISDGERSVSEEGSIVEKALNSPIGRENIETQLSKLGDTPFICKKITIDMNSDVFISLRELNEIRRLLVSELIKKRAKNRTIFVQNEVTFDELRDNYRNDYKISCFVRNEEQLQKCLKLGIKRIYVDNFELYKNYIHQDEVFYQIPRCVLSSKKYVQERNLVSDYGYYLSGTVGNYALNVTNCYTAYYLHKIGISTICLSVELTEKEVNLFLQKYYEKFGDSSFEVLAYGRVENMIIKGNILDLNKNQRYQLMDSKKRVFPVFYDGRITHVLNCENQNLDFSEIKGNYTLRFDFYDETANEIEKKLNHFFKMQKE